MRVGIDSYSYHRRYGEHAALVRPPRAPAVAARARHRSCAHARRPGGGRPVPRDLLPPGTRDDRRGDARRPPARASASASRGVIRGRTAHSMASTAAGRPAPRSTWRAGSTRAARSGPPGACASPWAARVEGRRSRPRCSWSVSSARHARAAERAAEAGVRLAIENHGDLRAQDILEIIERVGRPEPGRHAWTTSTSSGSGDDMLGGHAGAGAQTLLVQLKDHPRHADPTVLGGRVCTALGEGVAAARRRSSTSSTEAGFDGPVCVELASLGGEDVDELAMIERSVAWLRAHLPAPEDA